MIDKHVKQVLDNMPFPVWIKGLDNKIKYANSKFDDICNLSLIDEENKYDRLCKECYLNDKCNNLMYEVIENNKEMIQFDIDIYDKISKCYITQFKDKDKNVIGFMGMLMDIRCKCETQKKLDKNEHILRTIIDTIPDYIFYKDKNCRYLGYNKKWKDFYMNLGIHSMIGKSDFESGAVPYELAKKFVEEDKYILKNKKIKICEREFKDKSGNLRVEETIKVPVINDNGDVWGIVGLASDVTEKIELKEKLIKLSYTDSLTGVYNRACFEDKKNELNKSKYLPIGVIMGDVNGLKVVNDTFGHLEGDKLLKEIANVLKLSTREEDYIFRWGGDEFVILMPNCGKYKCEEIIANILNRCKKSKFNLIELSIALGSSIKDTLEKDLYENLKEAEEKLYRQKFLKEKSIQSSIIFSLFQSLHDKQIESKIHIQKLVKYALKIGYKLGFTPVQLDELELVTKLHDIGKVGIDKDILLKKEQLTDEEIKIIKTHTEKGYRILQASSDLSHISRVVLTHHEKYDGSGYPLGLKGEEIPIMARIIRVVDFYDSIMDSKYKNRLELKSNAIEEIKRYKGKKFDPKIVDIFIEILELEKEY